MYNKAVGCISYGMPLNKERADKIGRAGLSAGEKIRRRGGRGEGFGVF